VQDRENRPMTRMSPRRSYRLRIAMAVAMAMLMAGCGSTQQAGSTGPNSKGDAGTTTLSQQPSVPSPGRSGSLAYGVDGDIYVADWDGSNPVRIADGRLPNECFQAWPGEYWGEGPIWSPDGRYLAYRHTNCDGPRDAWRNVVISDPEGNVIAEFPADGWQIAWSPDSTRVAVWVTVFETIGVFGVDGERQALLTMPRGWRPSGDHDPVWLPDGKSLLQQGVVIPIDGSTPHWLSSARGTPSPDGSRSAYATRKSLVVAEADGSNPQEVFDGWVWDPVWSPTGDRIAFMARIGSGSEGELRVLDVATGTVRSVVEPHGSDRGTAVFLSVIDWSPENDRILFSREEAINDDPSDPGSYRRVGVGSLWSVDADGSESRRLVAGTTWGDWLSPNCRPRCP
jgi:Tol biopolymer transport system component